MHNKKKGDHMEFVDRTKETARLQKLLTGNSDQSLPAADQTD